MVGFHQRWGAQSSFQHLSCVPSDHPAGFYVCDAGASESLLSEVLRWQGCPAVISQLPRRLVRGDTCSGTWSDLKPQHQARRPALQAAAGLCLESHLASQRLTLLSRRSECWAPCSLRPTFCVSMFCLHSHTKPKFLGTGLLYWLTFQNFPNEIRAMSKQEDDL